MTKAEYKEHEANAVAEKADRGRGRKWGHSGQRRSTSKGQCKIDRTGHQSLDHGDLQRIGRAELAGEIVVDAPRDAGKDDQHTAPVKPWAGDTAFRPGKQ